MNSFWIFFFFFLELCWVINLVLGLCFSSSSTERFAGSMIWHVGFRYKMWNALITLKITKNGTHCHDRQEARQEMEYIFHWKNSITMGNESIKKYWLSSPYKIFSSIVLRNRMHSAVGILIDLFCCICSICINNHWISSKIHSANKLTAHKWTIFFSLALIQSL